MVAIGYRSRSGESSVLRRRMSRVSKCPLNQMGHLQVPGRSRVVFKAIGWDQAGHPLVRARCTRPMCRSENVGIREPNVVGLGHLHEDLFESGAHGADETCRGLAVVQGRTRGGGNQPGVGDEHDGGCGGLRPHSLNQPGERVRKCLKGSVDLSRVGRRGAGRVGRSTRDGRGDVADVVAADGHRHEARLRGDGVDLWGVCTLRQTERVGDDGPPTAQVIELEMQLRCHQVGVVEQ